MFYLCELLNPFRYKHNYLCMYNKNIYILIFATMKTQVTWLCFSSAQKLMGRNGVSPACKTLAYAQHAIWKCRFVLFVRRWMRPCCPLSLYELIQVLKNNLKNNLKTSEHPNIHVSCFWILCHSSFFSRMNHRTAHEWLSGLWEKRRLLLMFDRGARQGEFLFGRRLIELGPFENWWIVNTFEGI